MPPTMQLTEAGNVVGDNAAAFGRGSDARLAGLPSSACPYDWTEENTLADAWGRGWKHTDLTWGIDAGGRWPVAVLPVIGG